MSSPMRSTTHSQRLRDFALLPTLPDDVRVLVQQALGEQTRGEQGGLVACAATLRRAATAANAVHSLHTHDVEAQAAAAEAAVSASTFVRMCHVSDAPACCLSSLERPTHLTHTRTTRARPLSHTCTFIRRGTRRK